MMKRPPIKFIKQAWQAGEEPEDLSEIFDYIDDLEKRFENLARDRIELIKYRQDLEYKAVEMAKVALSCFHENTCLQSPGCFCKNTVWDRFLKERVYEPKDEV